MTLSARTWSSLRGAEEQQRRAHRHDSARKTKKLPCMIHMCVYTHTHMRLCVCVCVCVCVYRQMSTASYIGICMFVCMHACMYVHASFSSFFLPVASGCSSVNFPSPHFLLLPPPFPSFSSCSSLAPLLPPLRPPAHPVWMAGRGYLAKKMSSHAQMLRPLPDA